MFDQALDGMVSFSLAGSKTLTTNNGAPDEARCRYINITGGTGGTVTVPNVEKVYVVRNNSSASVTFTTGSGTTASVAAGVYGVIVSEGGNVCRNLTSLIDLSNLTGTLPVAHGGTGATSSTGSGGVVLKNGPTLGSTVTIDSQGSPNAVINFVDTAGTPQVTSGSGSMSVRYVTGQSFLVNNMAGGQDIKTDSGGVIIASGTTASAANLFQAGSAGSNYILRSTSSVRYKRQVEDADPVLAHRFLDLRPIWYRSTSMYDDPTFGFFGFMAEDAAAQGLPQLVHYAYQDDQIEHVVFHGNTEIAVEDALEAAQAIVLSGTAAPAKQGLEAVPLGGGDVTQLNAVQEVVIDEPVTLVSRPKAGERQRPDGFQYDRAVVLHHVLLRELFDRLEALEAIGQRLIPVGEFDSKDRGEAIGTI
jgi:hypothetical protein